MNNQMPNITNHFSGFTPPNIGNLNNPSFETGNEKMRQGVYKSRQIRTSLGQVINSRANFSAILKQWNIELLTSAKELDETGDFVASSYVVYKNYNDFKEPLFSFLQRYPDFSDQVKYIENVNQNIKGRIGLSDIKFPDSYNNPYDTTNPTII